MADYPLKQEAAEVQDILDGALLSNKGQTFSEETKAFIRQKIGASATGEGLKILSHFDTLEELQEAVPQPNAGDAFSVGTELPYNLYIFDFYNGVWKNYGPIRANDIKARFAQNVVVPTSAWVEDKDVFVDYPFKALITLAEITGNDFPIVAFAPPDATGGNYCPIAYCFDGRVEIWAKTIPAADITIPAATFIIQDAADGITGNSTKGITNASGGVPTGGIGNAQLADGSVTAAKVAATARTQYYRLTIPAEWDGTAAPYSRTVMAEGMLETDLAKVYFSAPDDFELLEAHQEAFSLLYDVESANESITFFAKDKPEVAFAVLVEVNRI